MADDDSDEPVSRITDEEVEHVKAAVAAMLDGKVAYWRDHDEATSNAKTIEARDHMVALSEPGAIMFGDLASGIARMREGVLTRAVLADVARRMGMDI